MRRVIGGCRADCSSELPVIEERAGRNGHRPAVLMPDGLQRPLEPIAQW
jgi:hypothetical protein